MSFPQLLADNLPAALWWVCAILSPCLLALMPLGGAQKGGRP